MSNIVEAQSNIEGRRTRTLAHICDEPFRIFFPTGAPPDHPSAGGRHLLAHRFSHLDDQSDSEGKDRRGRLIESDDSITRFLQQ